MRRYPIAVQVTDPEPGWKLGTRVLPSRYTIVVERLFRVRDDGTASELLTDDEYDAVTAGAGLREKGWVVGATEWLRLDVSSSPAEPPRCVALHAAGGIGTAEQRFPLAGIIAEASAAISSRTGSFKLGSFDLPTRDEYDDALFEAKRARGRKRTRDPVTADRLEAVAHVARQHPGKRTAAVKAHFRISRGYARKLIKQAEQAGIETVGL